MLNNWWKITQSDKLTLALCLGAECHNKDEWPAKCSSNRKCSWAEVTPYDFASTDKEVTGSNSDNMQWKNTWHSLLPCFWYLYVRYVTNMTAVHTGICWTVYCTEKQKAKCMTSQFSSCAEALVFLNNCCLPLQVLQLYSFIFRNLQVETGSFQCPNN